MSRHTPSSVQVTGGIPQPQPEAEERVRLLCQQMDPLLDIRWMEASVWNRVTERFEGRYAVICHWPQNDRRWELYRDGSIGTPFDLLGWFTEAVRVAEADWWNGDALPVDLDGLAPLVLAHLAKMDCSREPWKVRMRNHVAANEALRAQRKALIEEEMVDHLLYHRKRLAHEPIVNLGDGHSHLGGNT